MIDKLFSYKSIEDIDTDIVEYYEVYLKQPVGDFKTNTYFPSAVIDSTSGAIEFTDLQGLKHSYTLYYSIGDEITC